MRLIVAVAAAVGLLVSVTVHGQGVTREYDRFKDRTSHDVKVELSSLGSDAPGIELSLSATTTGGKSIGKTDKVSLTAMVTYNLSHASGCSTGGVDALIDSKPMSLVQAIAPFFYGGHAIVTTRRELTYGEAQALANSKLAEFRICGQVYTLTPEQLSTFKALFAPAFKPASS